MTWADVRLHTWDWSRGQEAPRKHVGGAIRSGTKIAVGESQSLFISPIFTLALILLEPTHLNNRGRKDGAAPFFYYT